jgi:hypothetical protein
MVVVVFSVFYEPKKRYYYLRSHSFDHRLRVWSRHPSLSGPVVNWSVDGGDVTNALFGLYGRNGLPERCLQACK